jgi:hypothetical protein
MPIPEHCRFRTLPDDARGCTDLFCAGAYLALTGLVLAVAGYSFIGSAPIRSLYPFDSDRRACGLDLPDHPYLYLASPFPDLPNSVCVHSCPGPGDSSLDCVPNSVVDQCQPRHSPNRTLEIVLYPAEPIQILRFCMPREHIQEMLPRFSLVTSQFNDLLTTKPLMISALLTAVLLCGLLYFLVRWVIKLIFCLAFLAFLFLAILVATLLLQRFQLQVHPESSLLLCACLLLALTLAAAYYTFSHRRKIDLMENLILVSSEFLAQVKLVYAVPVLQLVAILLAILAYFFL